MTTFRPLALSLGLLIAACAPAAAADYALDPAHTQAQFTVTHLAISKVHGQIPVIEGKVSVNPGELPTAANAVLDVTKLDSHDEKRDASLRSPDFFDAAKYPTISFVSTKITGTPAAFTMTGNLSMHGVTRPVVLNGKLEGQMTDGRGRHHIALSAAATVDRREWGMNWGNFSGGALIAGYEVTIELDVDAFAATR